MDTLTNRTIYCVRTVNFTDALYYETIDDALGFVRDQIDMSYRCTISKEYCLPATFDRLIATMQPATPPAPVRTEDALVTCDRCNGRRTFTCRMCSGVGALDGINGRGDSQCPECNGDGRVDCLQCKGTGKMEVAAPLPATDTTKRNRFQNSKCNRCGKFTPPIQNGEHNLFVLSQELGVPLSDQGDFCEDCCAKYDRANWLQWFAEHRPSVLTDQPQPDAEPVASAAAHTTTDLHFDKQGGVTIVEQKGLHCPECDGTGRVMGLNNRVRNCSKCHGKGVLPSEKGGPTKGAKLTDGQLKVLKFLKEWGDKGAYMSNRTGQGAYDRHVSERSTLPLISLGYVKEAMGGLGMVYITDAGRDRYEASLARR